MKLAGNCPVPELKRPRAGALVVARFFSASAAGARSRLPPLAQSARILRQCFDKIPGGPHGIPLNYRIKIPEGETYQHIESPRGDIGCYLVSRGGDMPWRCKFRTPSFVHIQIFRDLLPGVLIPDIMAICASFDIVLPETDR